MLGFCCIAMYISRCTYWRPVLMIAQFSHSFLSDFLWPHELQPFRPPCPSPTPGVYPNSCPLSQWCHPTISSSLVPFSSHPQSFPASRSFQMSQLFAIRWLLDTWIDKCSCGFSAWVWDSGKWVGLERHYLGIISMYRVLKTQQWIQFPRDKKKRKDIVNNWILVEVDVKRN